MCLSVIRVLARIWQSASATRRQTQGTCALDFAGGSAPCTPRGALPPAVACTNIDAAAMSAV